MSEMITVEEEKFLVLTIKALVEEYGPDNVIAKFPKHWHPYLADINYKVGSVKAFLQEKNAISIVVPYYGILREVYLKCSS